ncbi:hypothetical protein [Arthrobacter cupressi]|uniref:Uncharacterized protein n=1 Tax=Arthrobacter cupressi TaxID=1045773 RepID=A0A1G8R0Z8_9MICC|nr:hypothetical protein [Arthrobacter cupressi]NYD77887.1 hypothetical protein [Arthrobacter cupressi]SDJ10669.1 hypothetical protein SAMN05216555_10754 [Arthrobacter cupressi]
MSIQMKPARKLRVHWPISAETFHRAAGGDLDALSEDEGVASLLKAVEQFQDLGDFGNYKHVFESTVGFEGFTCAAGATPTLGVVGERTISPTFVFTTYFDAMLPDDAVEGFMHQLAGIHPWELPVIELTGPVTIAAHAHAGSPEGKAA